MEETDIRSALHKRFRAEALRSNIDNKTAIRGFDTEARGAGLGDYLRRYGWEDDTQGLTKLYVVKDLTTKEIVFYFGLKAGLLYRTKHQNDTSLNKTEKQIVQTCVQALFEEPSSEMEDFVLSVLKASEADPDVDTDKVKAAIQEGRDIRKMQQNDPDVTAAQFVAETYPGIVITQFCGSTAAKTLKGQMPVSLGFWVFWEIIVEKVLDISKQLGCKYLYLFAADQTEQDNTAYDSMTDADDKPEPVYKLVDYYRNALGFDRIDDLLVLKPEYDLKCHSMFQPIDGLKDARKKAWLEVEQTLDQTKQ